MRGSFKSKRLMRCFRTQIPKNATMIILETTSLPHQVPQTTLRTVQLSEWNEKPNSRESAKKSTVKPNRISKKNTSKSLKPRSNPGGSSLRKSTCAFSSVSSSRTCGSKWRTTPRALPTVSPVSRNIASKWATRRGSSRPCNRRNLTKRGRKGMSKYIWVSTWKDRNSRSKRVSRGGKQRMKVRRSKKNKA